MFLLKLRTYCYEKNKLLEHYFISYLSEGNVDKAREYASLVLGSVKTSAPDPKVVEDSVVEIWKAISEEELKIGRGHCYSEGL